MNVPATELPNFIRKYNLLHELLIFKYWRQNISVSTIIALHTAVRHSGVHPQSTRDSASVNSWNTRLHHSSRPANSPDFNHGPLDISTWTHNWGRPTETDCSITLLWAAAAAATQPTFSNNYTIITHRQSQWACLRIHVCTGLISKYKVKQQVRVNKLKWTYPRRAPASSTEVH